MNIKKRILCMVLAVFTAGLSFSGCAGRYALFNKAHPVIGNLGGKWVGAVVNWIIGIPIIYPITIFADICLFNVIEFWSGKNVLASGKSFEQTDENGNRLAAVKNDDGTLSVKVTELTGETSVYLLDCVGNDVSLYDADGALLSCHTVTYEELSSLR
ncbi:MAG: DUF3332 domain-containing protein [Spirochaetaceae bacterium]|jgi:hypothetical protein|nr:DUF3332 domain-containing protein [Spirochaetaceae bacterium]